jgi:hypothetical protein
MNASQIAQEACNTTDILDPDCIDVLLLALTPAAYSSNNTADTPGRLALISPAQVGSMELTPVTPTLYGGFFGLRVVLFLSPSQWPRQQCFGMSHPSPLALISPAQVGE